MFIVFSFNGDSDSALLRNSQGIASSRRDGDFSVIHKLPLAPCSKLLAIAVSVSKLTSPARLKIFAERRGFEPRKHFWRLHAFQACLFNHSSISPSRYFANRLQRYCFFRKYARVCEIFCVFFVILCQKVGVRWHL